MATRTVRLDEDSERHLREIRKATGMSVSRVLKRGVVALRDALLAESSTTAYDLYRSIDLGPGGYSRAPARRAKAGVRDLLRRRHR
ncbi:MAG: hypothetical protein ACREQ9_14270 [Candidatus Binatia bacterium]